MLIKLTVNSDADHEEGDEDVDDVEAHQGVLGAGEAATHRDRNPL